jgi:hypothetical protein
MKKYIYTPVILSFIISSSVFAQADSSDVQPLRGRPRPLPLALQERETPVTNITNQVTQVVQPNTYQVNGTGSGQTTATAQADCGGGKLLGGGGTCQDNQGLVAVAGSSPSGNSWVIGCQSLNYKPVFATATAICSSN